MPPSPPPPLAPGAVDPPSLKKAAPAPPPANKIESPFEKTIVGNTVNAAVTTAVRRLSSRDEKGGKRVASSDKAAREREERERIFFEEQRVTKEAEDRAKMDQEARMMPEEREKLGEAGANQ